MGLEPWVCAANIQGEMSLRCFVLRFRDSEPSVALTSVCFFAFSHRNTFYFCCRKNRRVRVLTIHKIKITKCKTWLFLFGAPPRVFDALRRILLTQILARTTRSVFHGSDSRLGCHSLPFPLRVQNGTRTLDPCILRSNIRRFAWEYLPIALKQKT